MAKSLFEAAWQPPDRFRAVSWDHVDPKIRPAIDEVVESLTTPHPKGLVLIGPVGSGKTSILWLVLREWIQQWIDRITPELPEWFDRMNEREGWGFLTEDEFVRRIGGPQQTYYVCKHAQLTKNLRTDAETEKTYGVGEWKKYPCLLERQLVCIDDLGVGYDDKQGWNLALQEQYFDWRWEVGRPLIITTNRGVGTGPGSLRGWLGWERIVDRLVDPSFSVSVVIPGPSKRAAVKDRQPEEAL